ncbi:MAG: pseudomurein-binding repeat-containing protein [Methanobacterium formicicum]
MKGVFVLGIVIVGLILFCSGCTSNNNITISESSGIPVSEVPNLASEVSKSTGSIQSIQFKGVNLSMNQCLYIFAKGIVMINSGEKGNIPIKTYQKAENPSGTVNSAKIAKNEYVDMADRTYKWMDQNSMVPNYIGVYEGGANDLSPEMLLKTFIKVLNEYKSNGKLPESVTVP